MKKSLLLIFFAMIILAGCSSKNWTGFYYPDANNIGDESTWIIEPWFSSLDECRNWVDDMIWNNTNYDYECGYKCRYKSDYGVNVCKETVK